MVFALFARRPSEHEQTRLPTPTPSVTSVAHTSPFRLPTALRSALGGSTTDSHSPAPPPPATPSPPIDGTRLLHGLMLTIPPKTLHAYTLAHLRPHPLPDAPRPPSPDTVTKLAAFFSTLAPPPLLHCVRCHKGFYDIENEVKDRACRVPHDDDSALVSRISGGGYETLWGCCGQTASGDGSEGPPDGWCYEGRHTTDVKRARFRADSTMHDDRLTSCFALNCHGVREQRRDSGAASPSRNVAGSSSARKSNPSPARSHVSVLAPRSARKRPRKPTKEASASENEADAESLASRAAKANVSAEKEKVGGGDDMPVAPHPAPKPKIKAKPKSQPLSRARPPPSTSTTASLSASGMPMASTKAKTTSRTLLSQSHTHVASDSETSTRLRPRTRSHVRDESRGHTTSKLTRADLSERAGRPAKKPSAKQVSRSSTSEQESEADIQNDWEERGRDRKKRRVGRR